MNVEAVVSALIKTGAYKATKYVSNTMTVKATRRHRLNKRDSRVEFVVTVGAPNYSERAFIKSCKKAGEPLPVKKVQLKFKPAKRSEAE